MAYIVKVEVLMAKASHACDVLKHHLEIAKAFEDEEAMKNINKSLEDIQGLVSRLHGSYFEVRAFGKTHDLVEKILAF